MIGLEAHQEAEELKQKTFLPPDDEDVVEIVCRLRRKGGDRPEAMVLIFTARELRRVFAETNNQDSSSC